MNTVCKLLGLIVAVVPLTACGVTVSSGDSDAVSVRIIENTVEYRIMRTDDWDYVESTVASGCINLDSNEDLGVEIDDSAVDAAFAFRWRVRDNNLVVTIREDGDLLHRSYHRKDLFHDGYTVEQKLVTGEGVDYLMTLEDTGCRL